MDDIAFDILANTLEMTMETPEGDGDSAEEKSKKGKKRKSEEVFEAPSDKKIKEEPQDEIELSGEPVFSSAPAPLSVLKAELKKKEVSKVKTSYKKSKSTTNDPVVKKLICSYCKKIFPSRPDFNTHMAVDHPDILSKHNTGSAKITKTRVEPVKKQEIKSMGRSVKITHIPSVKDKGATVIKIEKEDEAPVQEAEMIMKSIPKSTRIIFTPVAGVTAGNSSSKLTVKPKTINANLGKGVKITQIASKDTKVATSTIKSLKITPVSSKSVTITSTPPSPSSSNPAKKLLCSYCKSVFTTRPDFNQHIINDHPELSTKVKSFSFCL